MRIKYTSKILMLYITTLFILQRNWLVNLVGSSFAWTINFKLICQKNFKKKLKKNSYERNFLVKLCKGQNWQYDKMLDTPNNTYKKFKTKLTFQLRNGFVQVGVNELSFFFF